MGVGELLVGVGDLLVGVGEGGMNPFVNFMYYLRFRNIFRTNRKTNFKLNLPPLFCIRPLAWR